MPFAFVHPADDTADAMLRGKAAQALGRVGKSSDQDNTVPVQVLMHASLDADERVGCAALSALVEIDPGNAVDKLIELLRAPLQEPSSDASFSSADPSGKEHAAAEIPEPLQEMLDGHDPHTSTLASVLAQSAAQETTAVASSIETPVQGAPHASVRNLAARLMGNLSNPGPQAVQALIETFESANSMLRKIGRASCRERV